MSSNTPTGRKSSLPQTWDDMEAGRRGPDIPDYDPASKKEAVKPSGDTAKASGDATEMRPIVTPNVSMRAIPTRRSAHLKKKVERHSFWQDRRNWVLTAVVIFCPSIAMLILLALAKNVHPFEGRYHEGQTVSQWVAQLGADDPLERSKAFDTVVAMGDEASPQLARALRDPNVQRRRDAALALQKIRPQQKCATDALAGALGDRDLWVRWRSAQALCSIGQAARDAVSPLATALTDDDPRVRCAAAQALGRIGKDAALAHSALVEAMQDERTYVRRAASAAVASILDEQPAPE